MCGFVNRTVYFFIVLFAISLSSCGKKSGPQAGFEFPPAPVRIVKAARSDVPLDVSAIGTVEAYSMVEMKSRVAGQLQKVYFQEGQSVRKGDLLFEIDPKPWLEQIRGAEANLARDVALEKQAQANIVKNQAQAKSARSQADRNTQLFKEGIASREQNDQLIATAEAAEAALAADKATAESAAASIRADHATLSELKLQLGYTKISAPISGRVGTIAVKEGNLVKENDSVLVTILQVTPVYVTFSIPENVLPDVRKYNAVKPLAVEAVAANGDSVTGALRVIDNQVDNTTGKIKLKALFPNEKVTLWPGQFVNISALLRTEQNRILVPTRTVQTGPQGRYVWVLNNKDMTVAMKEVDVLRTRGEQSVIGTGLEGGETLISEGQMRLFPGGKVRLLEEAAKTAATSGS